MSKKRVTDLLAFKSNLIEILIIAILVALGVNISSSGLLVILNCSQFQSITIGGLLLIIGALFLLKKARPINTGEFKFEGVICSESESRELLSIDGYELSEDISRFVKALCSENKAFKKQWFEKPIGLNPSFKNGKISLSYGKSNGLLIEALEYYILRELSLHLSSHFNNDEMSEALLVKVGRKDIPSVLLENRFLELFSKPMDEREPFLDRGESSFNGKVVSAYGKEGAYYDRFEMILPKGSKIKRENNRSITLSTKRFRLNFKPIFMGMNSNLPRNFEELYLGKEFGAVSVFTVSLELKIEFSVKALFTAKGWEYYWWLDSFLNEIENSFSCEKFYSKISWYQNEAMIRIVENHTNWQRKKRANNGLHEDN
jgi:hypothetical protein